MDYIKVEDDKSLVRDSNNNAILNTDKQGLAEYKRIRNSRISVKQEIDDINYRLDSITDTLENIINILKEIK